MKKVVLSSLSIGEIQLKSLSQVVTVMLATPRLTSLSVKQARVLRELTVESEQLTRLKLEQCDSITWETLTNLVAKQSSCTLTLRECIQIDKSIRKR